MLSALQTGARVGKYELRRQLGEGGFGVVFVAHDTGLDRDVALKFLLPEHTVRPEVAQRFLQEARSAAKIAHSGIVTVYECGQVEVGGDEVSYIAMELLAGESLADRIARRTRVGPAAAVDICRQIASALEAAHRAGIIHRDLKPDNVFVVPDSVSASGERIKVLDFGIAKLADSTNSGVQTHSLMVFGTPRYMSPEQCRSAAHIDARSDVYALGCILFELLAGRPPFVGSAGELIAMHQLSQAPTVRSIAPDVPPPLDALVARMLAKDPAQRPASMADVERELVAAGSFAPGYAPTVLPAGIASPAGRLEAPDAGAPAATPRVTTLGSASGATEDHPASRGPRMWIAGAVIVLGAGGVALALRGRRPDQRGTPAVAAVSRDAGSSLVAAPHGMPDAAPAVDAQPPRAPVAPTSLAAVPVRAGAQHATPRAPRSEISIEHYRAKALALAHDGRCDALKPLEARARAVSPAAAAAVHAVSCSRGGAPSPARTAPAQAAAPPAPSPSPHPPPASVQTQLVPRPGTPTKPIGDAVVDPFAQKSGSK